MQYELMKYALVTGASSGIGWYISKELAEKGYSLVAVSNQEALLKKLKAEFEENYKVKVQTLECDLSSNDAANLVFDYCQRENIHVEVLVNNAGILIYGEVIDIETKQTEKILNLHMNTPVLLCRLFGKIMVDHKCGYILNVSSISAVMAYPMISLYGPTKTFLRYFSKALHIELKRNHVNVTCLLPGATSTPLYDIDEDKHSLALNLGVMKQPAEVAKAGVKALFKNKKESLPGFVNKLTVLLLPFIPTTVIQFLFKRYNHNKASK
ncbi:SDR family NAD(P)-dependent oxidoreductase [Lutimonas sp.]|uniref:SDR family NAD(P)-dependent oxidoreductase n=1 Tax=Lutimonas sp. TaxID=1872403 RepID=UPI003D9B1EA8